jgi:hypothetical protein
MTEDWGAPAWLPPGVQRRIAREDAAEARESRRAEAERETRVDEYRQRALAMYRDQAEARGEVVDALALARGEVPGRSVQDVLAAAVAASARDDARESARLHRDGHGDPEPVHVFVGEPRIGTAARSEAGRKIATRARRFRAVLEAKRALAAAEAAAEASRDDHGLVAGVRLQRPMPEPRSRSRRSASVAADDVPRNADGSYAGLRIRHSGGPVVGIW